MERLRRSTALLLALQFDCGFGFETEYVDGANTYSSWSCPALNREGRVSNNAKGVIVFESVSSVVLPNRTEYIAIKIGIDRPIFDQGEWLAVRDFANCGSVLGSDADCFRREKNVVEKGDLDVFRLGSRVAPGDAGLEVLQRRERNFAGETRGTPFLQLIEEVWRDDPNFKLDVVEGLECLPEPGREVPPEHYDLVEAPHGRFREALERA